MSLESIVNVQISKTGRGVTQTGFGTPLILGPSNNINPDIIRDYSSMDDVSADFAPSDPEYMAANAVFNQSPHPQVVKIGRRTNTDTAQVDHVTVANVQDSHLYGISINGNHATFTSGVGATANSILTGLKAAIDALSQPVTTGVSGSLLTITANEAGIAFTDEADNTDLTVTNFTASAGVVNDLVAIQNVDDDWYGLMLISRLHADIMDAAAWIETQFKMFCACSNDSAALSQSDTTSTIYQLFQKKYARTFALWSGDQANFPDAALLGRWLPYQPGSETAAFKTLTGNVSDNLTPTQITALKAKSCNYYIPLAGNDIVLDGVVMDKEYMDSIRFIDWFQKRTEERIFGDLVNVPKIPYTDQGIAVPESEVNAQIQEGIRVGGIATDPAPTVTAQSAVSQSSNDRANRFYGGLSFSWRLAGAIQSLTINGNVSV